MISDRISLSIHLKSIGQMYLDNFISKSCRKCEAAEPYNEYARTTCICQNEILCYNVIGIVNEGMLIRTLK